METGRAGVSDRKSGEGQVRAEVRRGAGAKTWPKVEKFLAGAERRSGSGDDPRGAERSSRGGTGMIRGGWGRPDAECAEGPREGRRDYVVLRRVALSLLDVVHVTAGARHSPTPQGVDDTMDHKDVG